MYSIMEKRRTPCDAQLLLPFGVRECWWWIIKFRQ